MKTLSKAKHKCTNCNMFMHKKSIKMLGLTARAWECKSCKEMILHPDDAQKILLYNKLKKGIPVKVGELGNSLIMRFPKELASWLTIKKGTEILLKAKDKEKLELTLLN